MERLLLTSRRYLTQLAALVVLALALALVAGVGPAASGTSTSITIAPKAAVLFFGSEVEAQVTVVCTGAGTINMTITQTAAQSGNGVGATSGSDPFIVEQANCDGTPHKVSVTVNPLDGLYDIGKATASATLNTTSGTATDTRTISLVSA
ncbi:MAG: hypothetical protein ACJ77E_02165 [Gaiellaceae bacterium]